MTLKEIPRLSKKAHKMYTAEVISEMQTALNSGNWMVRFSNEGISHGGFKWQPVGEWTEAPDWDPSPVCGGGLHGCNHLGFGAFQGRSRLDFCVTDGEPSIIDGDKIKVPWAKIVAVSQSFNIFEGLTVGGDLDLEGTPIKELPKGLTVGGSLYLRDTPIKELPAGLTVGRSLDLRDTPIKELPKGLTVGGYLYLEGTPIKELPAGLTIGGFLT